MKQFLQNESGATAIEYAFILALIVLIVFAGIVVLGKGVGNSYNNTATAVGAALK